MHQRKLLGIGALTVLMVGQCDVWADNLPLHKYGYLATSRDYSEVVFGDASTIKTSGAQRTGWELTIYDPVMYVDSKPLRYTLAFTTYDCAVRTQQTKYIYGYNDEREVVSSSTTPYAAADPVIPDSVGDGILSTVCSSDFPGSHRTFSTLDGALNAGLALIQHFKSEQAQAQQQTGN